MKDRGELERIEDILNIIIILCSVHVQVIIFNNQWLIVRPTPYIMISTLLGCEMSDGFPNLDSYYVIIKRLIIHNLHVMCFVKDLIDILKSYL